MSQLGLMDPWSGYLNGLFFPGLSGVSVKLMTESSTLLILLFRSAMKRHAFFFFFLSKSHSKSFCETCL